ncbi:MAG: MBL fold metallo-hydrolase [Thermodesulfobacteriota bacterium]
MGSERNPLTITVVYDNNPFNPNLRAEWGFSCFIEGLEKSILFDTGAKGQILLVNMEKLGIKPEEIDVIILSHTHRDHTGGLEVLISKKPAIEVWIPGFFPSDFKEDLRKKGE